MIDLLRPLLNFFTEEELNTAVPITNICEHCKSKCGSLFTLDNCPTKICGSCLDTFYDNYTSLTHELYRCPCHGKLIYDFNVIQ